MRQLILSAFITISFMHIASGQTLNAYVKGAEEAMAKKDYFSAYTFFRIAHEIEPNNIQHTYKLAEAARLFSAFTMAEKYYMEVAAHNKAAEYPANDYWLGYVKHRLGKYQEALDLYALYLSEHSEEDPELTAMAQKNIEAASWAITALEDADTVMELVHLGTEVNSTFSDFAATPKDSLLYFTSQRFLRPDDEVIPNKQYSKILISEEDGAGEVDSIINDPMLHTANTAFNKARDRVYYTLCEYINGSEIRCDLYYRDIVDGVYGTAQILPEPINMAGFTNTQPHVGYDPKTAREVLYFVSDRPGGAGRQDIWYSQIVDKDNFTAPENLVGLNTEFNDISPFYHRASNSLYFSTEGYPGFGGLDVFNVEYVDGVWQTPTNLGSPTNSSLDDAYYSLSDDEKEGYFSSNRLGSMYLSPEDEACCFDIYYFSKEPIEVTLKVITFNKHTGEPLNQVDVHLTEAELNTTSYSTGDTNVVIIPINRNTTYEVVGTKDEFDPDSAQVSTVNIKESKEIEQRLYLAPSKRVILVRTFEKRTRDPLEGVRVELVQIPGGTPQVQQETFATQYIFEADPNKEMKATGSKKGYLPESRMFNSSQDPGSDTLVIDLYLEIGNLEDFLPLAIYFDNDQPGRRTNSDKAAVRYLQTYEPYMAQKQKFIDKYSAGAPAGERAAAAQAVREFFENDLARGRREFESFMHILDQYLKEGLTFTIYLKGYTSPLASSDYNLALGKRRISSIQNEFKSFRDGILWKYMETGDLVVTEKSFGEETAPANVSDDRQNTRKSIYSPEASKERRVEIIEIQK